LLDNPRLLEHLCTHQAGSRDINQMLAGWCILKIVIKAL
jgi:hypothetical protein